MNNAQSYRKFLDIAGWAFLIFIITVLLILIILPWEPVPPDDVEITNVSPCLFIDHKWTSVEKFTVLKNPSFCGVMKTQYDKKTVTVRILRIGGGDGYQGHFEVNNGDFVIEIPERLKSGEYNLKIDVGRTKAMLDFSVTLTP